jgi:hypothetical protein
MVLTGRWCIYLCLCLYLHICSSRSFDHFKSCFLAKPYPTAINNGIIKMGISQKIGKNNQRMREAILKIQ